MNVLVTGAAGFVGKNLCCALENVRTGKDKTRPNLRVDEIFSYDIDTPTARLREYCEKADFVFHLAGVNRPKCNEEFMQGNFGFTSLLLDTLKGCGNTCPVMLSSSVQACCEGRYDGEYGRSKKAGEELFFSYAKETGARVLVYRFPNVFGKWCRPNYNSAVATFCHNIAHDLPITVNDRNTQITLVYIDDLLTELLDALEGKEHRTNSKYCEVPISHTVTLGELVDLLESFYAQPQTLYLPVIPDGSFAKKLYSTYLSYLPKEKAAFPLQMHIDERGSFTELLKTKGNGQFSVNISRPGVTKGQHWHHTKWEFFIVVSGRGLIRQRKVGCDEILEFFVDGDHIRAVHMLPGYTHSIVNLSDTENLVTLMWANEPFEANRPDTYYEEV